MGGPAGTAFRYADPEKAWPRIAPHLARTRSDASVLAAARAKCMAGDALCLESPDGIVVVTLRKLLNDTIQMKVLLAVGWHHGAFRRQEASMRRVAAALGADSIYFETDRRGWSRLLGPAWRAEPDGFSRSV